MTTRNYQLRYAALAVYLAIGVALVWGIVFGFGLSIIEPWFRSDDGFESLAFTQDNKPIIRAYNRNSRTYTYRDLDGKPISISDQSISDAASLNGPVDPQNEAFRLSWLHRVRDLGYGGPERWFFVCDDQPHCHGYLVGYNRESNAKIGYLGRNGFRTEEPPLADQFPISRQMVMSYNFIQSSMNYFSQPSLEMANSGATLVTEEGLVSVNLKTRTVKLVFKKDNIVSATIVDNILRNIKHSSRTEVNTIYPSDFLLRTPDRVLVLDVGNAKEIESYLLPKRFRDGVLSFVRLGEGKALVTKDYSGKLFWIDTTGKIVKQRDVKLRIGSSGLSKSTNRLTMSACMPSLAIIGGVNICHPWATAEVGDWNLGYGAALGKAIELWWPALLMLGVISVVLAVLCYRRQRKYGLEWTPFWVGFVLVGGVPAYLSYLVHRAWPARLPCPRCGKLAPRDREACFACHQEFPAPAPKGTEVFA